MRRGFIGLTIATLLASPAVADGLVLLPDGTGEGLAISLPEGWDIAADPDGADAAAGLVALRPVGGEDEADRIEIRRWPPAAGSTALLDGIETEWRGLCEALQYGRRQPFISGGFTGTVTTLGCTRRGETERGTVALIAVVPGTGAAWTLARIWEVPAFDVTDQPVSRQRLQEGAEELGRFALCRPDADPADPAAQSACPPRAADAIRAAGDSTNPIRR